MEAKSLYYSGYLDLIMKVPRFGEPRFVNSCSVRLVISALIISD